MLTVLVLVALASAQRVPLQQNPTPQQILRDMEKVYAMGRTYRDSGVVETVFIREESRRTVRKPFKTAFVRHPLRFRFEFLDLSVVPRDELRRYLVACDGDQVRTWWDLRPAIGSAKEIASALEAAAGVSSGSSYTIPPLLMPDQPWEPLMGNPMVALENLELLEDGEVEGAPCYRIGGDRDGEPVTLWIEKQRKLLRRVDGSRDFTEFRTESTTLFEPQMDVSVTEEELAFDPPESSTDIRPGGESETPR